MAGMVDTFLFLTLARTGDQLQGIKKGILEIADVIAVNKADGDREAETRGAAKRAGRGAALRARRGQGWVPPVLTCSGLTGDGRAGGLGAACWATATTLGEDGLRDQAGPPAAGLHLVAGARRAGAAPAHVAGCACACARRSTTRCRSGRLPATAAAERLLAAFDADPRDADRAGH